ncbi:MAG: sugar transferase [Burkholderiaceae bacterium]|nr:sugar transferase [Burkholderiaceae bacterium]
MKRFADVVIAAVLLLALSPLWLLIALLIRIDSAGPVLARPHRVGRNGRMIKVHEFRTAIAEPDAMETVGGCHGEQVTRIGALLRKTGWARWPMLLDVLRGDFSMVGPRAEMPRYVGCYPTEVRKRVLSVKPGLLDLSTIEFRAERKLLAGLEGEALETAYVEQVLPLRLDYAQRYLDQRGGLTDAWIMLRALLLPLRALRGE